MVSNHRHTLTDALTLRYRADMPDRRNRFGALQAYFHTHILSHNGRDLPRDPSADPQNRRLIRASYTEDLNILVGAHASSTVQSSMLPRHQAIARNPGDRPQ